MIPSAVQEWLGLRSGDMVRYRMTKGAIVIDKAPLAETADPFVTFSEWSGEADEKAYGRLDKRAARAVAQRVKGYLGAG